MTTENIIILIVVLLLAFWLFNYLAGSTVPALEEQSAGVEGLTSFGRQWYWPSYWYNSYWPFYRRRNYGGYPFGYFPYQSYYNRYFW